jgi:outer membrane protein
MTTTNSTGGISSRISQSGVKPADNFEDAGRIGITVGVPIFEGGRIRAQIAKERALLHADQQRLRRLELQIRLEVETAVLNLNSAGQRVSVTRKSIAEAEESLRIERVKYDFGKGAIVDVLDAQTALLGAQTTHYRALADLNTATAQVQLATGDNRP